MVHISPWEATLGLMRRGGRQILSRSTPFYLYGPYTRRGRNGREQPSIRPEPWRSQPQLGSARPLGGCRVSAIRWIFVSSYHRNARKKSERGVSPSLIVDDRPANGRFRNSHRARGSSLSVSRQRRSDDRMPKERSEKRNHKNPKDKAPRFERRGGVVARGQPVGIAHAKLLGRPPASQPHQTLMKIS